MADDLDTLTDAELRAVRIAQVTKSTQKVLDKRMRPALCDQASSTSKLEILAPAAPAAFAIPMDKPEGAKPATTNARRTIASTQAAGRRRPKELVLKTRRIFRSSENREEIVLEPQVVEVPAVPERTKYHKNTSKVNSKIILESDDKANEQLEKPGTNMTLNKSIHEYTAKTGVSSALMAHRNPVVDPPRRQAYKSSYDYHPTGRYNSYDVRSPAQSYVTAEAPALSSTSRYRHFKPLQPFVFQLTDDDEDEAPDVQKYANTYARHLTRLRSEGIGGRNSRNSTRTMGIKPQIRRSRSPDEVCISAALQHFVDFLYEAYNHSPKMFTIIVVVILIVVLRVFC